MHCSLHNFWVIYFGQTCTVVCDPNFALIYYYLFFVWNWLYCISVLIGNGWKMKIITLLTIEFQELCRSCIHIQIMTLTAKSLSVSAGLMPEDTFIKTVEWEMLDKSKFFPMSMATSFTIRCFLYPLTLIRTRLQVQRGKKNFKANMYIKVAFLKRSFLTYFFKIQP